MTFFVGSSGLVFDAVTLLFKALWDGLLRHWRQVRSGANFISTLFAANLDQTA